MENITRIIVTGDIFRPVQERWASAQRGNIHWFGRLVQQPLQIATNLSVDVAAWGHAAEDKFNDAEIEAIFAAFHAPLSLAGWAAIYDSAAPNEVLDAMVCKKFTDALVIGFEIPPVLERALKRVGIPVLNTAIHPVRYMDDIFLGFRSSVAELQDSLRHHAILEEKFRLMAGVQSAAVMKKSFFSPELGSLIVVGQVPGDASCIENGRFTNLEHFRNAIEIAAAKHKKIYYKPHPLAPADHMVEHLCEWGIDAESTNENIYYLLAHQNIDGVLTLSSSVGTEARYFGKTVKFLLEGADRLWRTNDPTVTDGFLGIANVWLAPDFWRDLLRKKIPVSQPDGVCISAKPNRLRLSLGCFWGYDHSDSKILMKQVSASGNSLDRGVYDFKKQSVEKVNVPAKMKGFAPAIRLEGVEKRLEDIEVYMQRSFIGRLFFRRNGKPIRILRRTLFHSDGRPRGIFRRWIIRSDGGARRAFRQWLSAQDYLCLPHAYRGSRPYRAWRSILEKIDLSDNDLDALMDRIRVELRNDATKAESEEK